MRWVRAFAVGVFLAGLALTVRSAGAEASESAPAAPVSSVESERTPSAAGVLEPVPASGSSPGAPEPAPAVATSDVTAIARSVSELKSEVRALANRLEATHPAAPGADSHTAKALEQIQSRIQTVEQLLAPNLPRYSAVLAGLAAVLVLVAIGAVIWARPRSAGGSLVPGSVTKKLEEIQRTVVSLGAAAPAVAGDSSGGARPGNEVTSTLLQAINALRSTSEKTARDERELATQVAQLQSVSAGLQPAVEAINACAAEIEQARGALAEERAAVERAKVDLAAQVEAHAAASDKSAREAAAAAAKIEVVEARLANYDALWPAAFQGNSVLGSVRERAVAACAEGRSEGIDLLAALVRWHMVQVSADRDRERWIEAADAIGRASCAFLAKEPTDGMGPAEVLERAQLWTRAFKTPLEQTFPELKLNAVYAGDRFDTDRMEAIGSVSGGRQTVHHALSWSLLEKTADSTRVVRRAQVITN